MILAIYFFFLFQPAKAQIREMGVGYKYRADPNTPAPVSACPVGLKILTKEDGDDTFFGLLRNYKDICIKAIASGNEMKSVHDLQLVFKERFRGLSEAAKSNIANCFEKDTEAERYLAAKYYYELNRLQDGTKAALQQVAAIDKLLPTSTETMSGIDCGHGYFLEAKKLCQDLGSQCKSKDPKAFDDFASKAEAAYKIKMQYDELVKLRRGMGGEKYTYKDPRLELDRKIQEVGNLYGQALEESPWIRGTEFEKIMQENYHKSKYAANEQQISNLYKNSIRQALRGQLQFNRKKLNEQIQEFSKAAECFEGKNTEFCRDGKGLRRVLSKTPSTNIQFTRVRSENIASQYLEAQQCVHDGKLDQDQTTDVLNDAAINATLTMATGGLSVGVGAARFGVALRGLKAGSLVQEPGKALATAYRYQRLGTYTEAGKAITRVEMAMGAVDTGVAVNSANKISNKCEKERVELDKLVLQQQGELCPSYNNAATQARDAYGSCMFAAYLEGGAGTLASLPIIAAIVGPVARSLKPMLNVGGTSSARRSSNAEVSSQAPRETAAATSPARSSANKVSASSMREGPFEAPPTIDNPQLNKLMRRVQSAELEQNIAFGNEVAIPLDGGFTNGRIIEKNGEKLTVAVQSETGVVKRLEINAREVRKPFKQYQTVGVLDESGVYYQTAISSIEGDIATLVIPRRPGSTSRGMFEDIRVPLSELRQPLASGDEVRFLLNGKTVRGTFKENKINSYQIEVDGKVYSVKPEHMILKPQSGEIRKIVADNGQELRVLVQEGENGDTVRVLADLPDRGLRTVRIPVERLKPVSMIERSSRGMQRVDVARDISDTNFKQAYVNDDFRGDKQFISFPYDGKRLAGKVVEVDASGEVVVALPGGTRHTIATKDLSSVRQSATSKKGFSELSEAYKNGDVIKYYDEASDQFRYGKIIAAKNDNYTISSADINGKVVTRKLKSSEMASAIKGDDVSLTNVVGRVQTNRSIAALQSKITDLEGELNMALNDKSLSKEQVTMLGKKINEAMSELRESLVKQGYTINVNNRGVTIGSHSTVLTHLEVTAGPPDTMAGYIYQTVRNRITNRAGEPVKVEIDIYSNLQNRSGGFYRSSDNLVNLKPSAILNENLDDMDSILYHELRHAKIQSLKEAKRESPYYVEFRSKSSDFNLMNPKSSGADELYKDYYSLDEVNSYLGEARVGLKYFASNAKRVVPGRYSVNTDLGNIQHDIYKAETFVTRSKEYMQGARDYVASKKPVTYDINNGVVTARVPLIYKGVDKGTIDIALVKSRGVADIAGNEQLLKNYLAEVIANNEKSARQIAELTRRLDKQASISEDILKQAEALLGEKP